MLYLVFKKLTKSYALSLLTVVFIGLAFATLMLQKNLEVSLGKLQTQNNINTDLVIGAKGSPLQLVLSSVFHVDQPVGNINLKDVKKWCEHPFIASCLPISIGDNYKSKRIIGTNRSYVAYFSLEIDEGKNFSKPGHLVLGNAVAKHFNLQLNDTLYSAHGLHENGHIHDNYPLTVTGILASSDQITNNLIFTSLETVWDAHHQLKEDSLEITSLLLTFKNPIGALQLPRQINNDTNFQAAVVAKEMNQLNSLLEVPQKLTGIFSLIILFLSISGLTFYFTLFFRKSTYEIALLTSYGNTKVWLFSKSLLELIFLYIVGVVFGLLVGIMATYLFQNILLNSATFTITQLNFNWLYFFQLVLATFISTVVLQTLLLFLFSRKPLSYYLYNEK